VLTRFSAPFSLGGIQNSLRIYAPFDNVTWRESLPSHR
jgi:hypothetical protein